MTINEINDLSCIEIEPSDLAKHSIIWLHGLGADGNDFVPVVPELHLPKNLAIRFIFPHAPIMPISINNGYEMRAWYDIKDISLNQELDFQGMEKSQKAIRMLIDKEVARGISTENILLAGFSQGAVIALLTGLQYEKPLAGIIALSGYLALDPNTMQKNHPLPIFIAHGTEDPLVPYALGKAAASALETKGYPVSWHSYPVAHGVCIEEINDISTWIQNIWK